MFAADWSKARHHIGRRPQGLFVHLWRFAFRSPHCRDLRTIAALTALFVLLLSRQVDGKLRELIGWVDLHLPAIAGFGEFCQSMIARFEAIAGTHDQFELALLGGAAAIIGWAYQAANTRFGIADIFAAEIATLCRVAAVAEFMPRYKELYDSRSKFPTMTPPRDYFAIFNNNAKDLEMLDGDVARYVTQFYVYMKTLQDTLARGADPQFDLNAWRSAALTVVYNAFLGFESARQAISVLMDNRLERQEYVLTALLSEVPAYLLLHREREHLGPLRRNRIEDRHAHYQRLIRRLGDSAAAMPQPSRELALQTCDIWRRLSAETGAPSGAPPTISAATPAGPAPLPVESQIAVPVAPPRRRRTGTRRADPAG